MDKVIKYNGRPYISADTLVQTLNNSFQNSKNKNIEKSIGFHVAKLFLGFINDSVDKDVIGFDHPTQTFIAQSEDKNEM